MPDGEGPRGSRPEHILEDILVYFRDLQRRKGWTCKKLYDTYFDGRVAENTLKKYLRRQGPKRSHPFTIERFREASRQARAEEHPAFGLHLAMLEAVERDEPSPREFKLYQGRYRFWRHGRFGLVDGTVEILRHDVAGNPYHLHVHTQVVDENGKYSRTFSYEGGVIWLERNLWFIHVGKGEIRFALIPRVTNPRREHMVGMFLGEEHDGNRNPFGGKTLLCHEDWLEHNGDLLTEDWILAQLRNGAPKDAAGGQDMMRM